MKNCEKTVSARSVLTELIKFKSHQKYLDKDLSTNDSLVNVPELNKLKMEQEINWPTQRKGIQHDTQRLIQMVTEFHERMINVTSLCNNNTKKYREEIQSIDSQLKKIDSKNVSELKQLKLEYCQIEEATFSLNRIIFERNHPLTSFASAKYATTPASKRKVMSAPVKRRDSAVYQKGKPGSWTSE